MKEFFTKYKYLLVSLLIVAVTLAVDIVSKILIHNLIPTYSKPIDVIPYLFSFVHVHNEGAAFSFGADSEWAMTFFIVMTFIALAVITFAVFKWGKRSKLLLVSLSLIFSGALGNLIDRLKQQYVDDFIRFTFWPDFAIFNVADICVCVGAVMFLVYFLFFEGKKEKAEKEAAAKAAEEKAADEARSEEDEWETVSDEREDAEVAPKNPNEDHDDRDA